MLGKPVFTNKIVAKNLGIDESRVTKVTGFFYREFNQELKNCEHPFVFVRGLGTFAMNPKTIDGMIKSYLSRKKYNKGRNYDNGDTVKKGLFELFRIRRIIKNQLKENKRLKNVGKTIHDCEG